MKKALGVQLVSPTVPKRLAINSSFWQIAILSSTLLLATKVASSSSLDPVTPVEPQAKTQRNTSPILPETTTPNVSDHSYFAQELPQSEASLSAPLSPVVLIVNGEQVEVPKDGKVNKIITNPDNSKTTINVKSSPSSMNVSSTSSPEDNSKKSNSTSKSSSSSSSTTSSSRVELNMNNSSSSISTNTSGGGNVKMTIIQK